MSRPSFSFVMCCVVVCLAPEIGCYATVSPVPGPGYEEDDVVYGEPPSGVETYPVVVYAGAPHYYVGGRWYRRSPRGWGYYRHEPDHLAKHRPPHHEEHHDEHPEHR
jgi:hypothetical protein